MFSISSATLHLCGSALIRFFYCPKISANINGATIDASDSIMYLGVSAASLPQVIFSFGTAPEYEP